MSEGFSMVEECEVAIKSDRTNNNKISFDPLNEGDASWEEIKKNGIMYTFFSMKVQTNNYIHGLKYIRDKLSYIINKESEKIGESKTDEKKIIFCPVCGSMDINIQYMGSVGEELSVDYYCYECESNGDIDINDKN